jgi:AGCS family alanine or glycine:cation symporter
VLTLSIIDHFQKKSSLFWTFNIYLTFLYKNTWSDIEWDVRKERKFMLEAVNRVLNGAVLPLTLLLSGIFYACQLKFFPVFKISAICKVLAAPKKGSGVSPFRSLTMALAGTLGVGNIVGVASAVAMGGAGAVFWMWVCAFAAMLLKYAEVLLGVKYREKTDEGFRGGAPYYIKQGLSMRGFGGLGVGLAGVFSVLCIAESFTTGCSIQSAAVSSAMYGVMGIDPHFCGFALALACGVLLIRGREMVMRVTEYLVPLMCVGFLCLSFLCMAANSDKILPAFAQIFKGAFRSDSAAYGVGGFFLGRAVRFGTMRGLLSNEAGCGTSPFAHAAADTKSPVEQGFWGIFEVFVDTILLCTVTAVVVIMNLDKVSGFSKDPMMMAIRAYSCSFQGGWASMVQIFLGVSVLCFGFATFLCWAQYGLSCVGFFSARKRYQYFYILLFSLTVYWGAVAVSDAVWSIADLSIGLMVLLHVPILCVFCGEVRRETQNYFGWK